MAQIGLNIDITGLSGFLIIRWLKASAPTTEVGRNDNPSTLTFPYDNVYVIPNLAPVVYIVQLWRSDDGVTLDQLIKPWSIDASRGTAEASIRTYQYKVDRGFNNVNQSTGDLVWADPTDGQIILEDQRLDGFEKDDLIVHEAGYGNKLNEEYDLFPGGGIELLGGKTFDSGVAWFITVSATTEGNASSGVSTSSTSKYTGVAVMTANSNFDADHRNKLVITNGAGTNLTETFPALDSIPDETHVTYNTHKGSQNYLRLQFDGSETVRFNNADVNFIDLAKNETIDLFFFEGVCYVTSYNGNAMRRGSVMPDYKATRHTDLGNLIYADEATGVLNKADYEGLYYFVSQLTGDAVCPLGTALGQWSYDSGGGVYPNKVKYGISGTTFRVPHLSGLVAKLNSLPGVFEAAQVGEISQTIEFKQGASDDNESGISLGYLRLLTAGGGTSYPHLNVPFVFNSGLENKVKSYSQKPFIYL